MRYDIESKIEFGRIPRSEYTPRERCESQIQALAETFTSIDAATGKWVSNSIRDFETVLGDHGRLGKPYCRDVQNLTGESVETYHDAAKVLIRRLRAVSK